MNICFTSFYIYIYYSDSPESDGGVNTYIGEQLPEPAFGETGIFYLGKFYHVKELGLKLGLGLESWSSYTKRNSTVSNLTLECTSPG